MVIRERWRVDAFHRSAKAMAKTPAMVIRLPGGLADVWPYDGKALILPGWRRSAILVDWPQAMRYVRRRL